MMRELQQQRRRAKGVTLEPKAALDEVEEALAAGGAEAAPDHGLDSTFTSQTDSGEVDPEMLKYIEQQMQGGGAGGEDGEKPRGGVLDADEAELYTTPAHLIGVVPGGSAAEADEESAAQRWLAGITEVDVSTEDKMANIEATEKAKRDMMQKQAEKKRFSELEAMRNGHKMEVPGNYSMRWRCGLETGTHALHSRALECGWLRLKDPPLCPCFLARRLKLSQSPPRERHCEEGAVRSPRRGQGRRRQGRRRRARGRKSRPRE